MRASDQGIEACGLKREEQLGLSIAPDQLRRLARQPYVCCVSARILRLCSTSVDELAVGVLKAAAQLERQVPETLSIVGYDHSVLSECTNPRISTIDNKVEDLCAIGITLLGDLLAGKTVAKKYIINCELIEKETT